MRALKLQNRPGTGAYNKGQERILQILQASRDILIDQGYSGLSMRKIAASVGITIGNLHYYYRTKKDLLSDLLDHVIEGYLETFNIVRSNAGDSPAKQMVALIEFIIDDLNTQETTNFFPELWALSNHDENASDGMHTLYGKVRKVFKELILELNPTLSGEEGEQVALFITASMEGLTPFVGRGKPWESKLPSMKRIATLSFLHLAKNIKSAEITELQNTN